MLVPKIPEKYFHMNLSGEMVAKMHKPAGSKHLSREKPFMTVEQTYRALMSK